MKITYVMPMWNSAKTLERSLVSVISQKGEREIIVVDGGSTDGTLEIVQRYADSIDRVISEPDRGMFDAVNKGIRIATGTMIKIHNSDDLLLPDAQERAVKAARSLSAAQLTTGYVIYAPLIVEYVDGTRRLWSTTSRRFFERECCIGLHPSWFVSKDAYDKHGLYDSDFRIASDYEYNLRLRRAGVHFHMLEEPVASFALSGMSRGWQRNLETYRANRSHLGAFYAFYYEVFSRIWTIGSVIKDKRRRMAGSGH